MINNAPMVRLGDYIEECDERNSDNALTLDALKGISTSKVFIETKANKNVKLLIVDGLLLKC